MMQRLRILVALGMPAVLASCCLKTESTLPRGNQVLNLAWDARDPNGLPHNPRWAFQQVGTDGQMPPADPEWQCGGFPTENDASRRRGDPPCTDQETNVDLPSGWHKPVCGAEFLRDGRWGKLRGHVNWKPATVSGYLTWNDLSGTYPFGDGDYTLSLEPAMDDGSTGRQGLTVYNKVKGYQIHAYHIEFNGKETAERFGHEWWTAFRDNARSGRVGGGAPAEPGRIPDGSYAIVTGLFGLDVEHKGHSELHPVYALSVLASCADAPDTEGYFNDEWAVFVRDWGNEGFCADWKAYHMLDLPDAVYSLRIPLNEVDPTSVMLGEKTRFFANLPRATEVTRAGKGPFLVPDATGVVVRFRLPESAGPITRENDPPRLHGLLHLRWKATHVAARSCPRRPPAGDRSLDQYRSSPAADGEDVMRLLQENRRSRGLLAPEVVGALAARSPDAIEVTDRTAIPAPAVPAEIRDRVVRVPDTAGAEREVERAVDEPPPTEVCEEVDQMDLGRLDQRTRRRMEELRKYCARTRR